MFARNWSTAAVALLAAYAGSAGGGRGIGDGAAGGAGGVVPGAPAGGSDSGSVAGSVGVPYVPCDTTWSLPKCFPGEPSHPATLRAVNLLILLDKSGSMSQTGLGSTGTKWDAMKTALATALNRSRTLINFGLDLFPRADVPFQCSLDQCCQTPALSDPLTVPVGPGVDAVPQITDALNATSPGGGTPAAAALARAVDYYTLGDGRNLTGDKYVMLVTDGAPSCNAAAVCDATKCIPNLLPDPEPSPSTNYCATSGGAIACLDDQSVLDQIDALRAAGITTIVVGLPGSEPYAEYLNAFAIAGGRPQPGADTAYYAAAESAGAEGLAETLQRINVGVGCVIQSPAPPLDPDLFNALYVLVDCNIVPRESVDGGGSSWTLDLAAETITLQGDICEQIINQGVERIDYIFGCDPS
jgi:hypothetical protein